MHAVTKIMDTVHFLAFFVLLSGVCSQTDDNSISCQEQKKKFGFIRCNGDRFNVLQCKDRYCYCVDGDTGTQIEQKSFSDTVLTIEKCLEDDSSCEDIICPLDRLCGNGYKKDNDGCETCECEEQTCPNVLCDNITCANGYKLNSNGCKICECAEDGCSRCNNDERCVLDSVSSQMICQELLDDNEECKREIDEKDFDDDDDNGSDDNKDDGSDNSDDGSDDGTDNSDDGSDDGADDRDGGEDGGDDGILPPVGKRDAGSNRDDAYSISSLTDVDRRLLSSDSEDEEKQEKLDEIKKSFIGSSSRLAVRTIKTAISTCRTGYFCERAGFRNGRCTRMNDTSEDTCFTKSSDRERDCDSNGFYKHRLCYKVDDGKTECVCVFPNNGTRLENTRTIIKGDDDDDDDEKQLQCADYIYRSCLVTIGERSYQVKHGETHFDKCNCRSCVCYFGRIYCEEPQDVCRRAKCADEPQAADCALNNGTVVLHGQTIIQDCNKCICKDSNIYCTERDCDINDNNDDDDDDEKDMCKKCRSQPVRRVCGSNGQTYYNKCTALYCYGLSPVDIIDGPCAKHDPCDRFPCDKDEICLRKGGVSCLSRYGCKPYNFRVCVNTTNVPCDYTLAISDDTSNNYTDDNNDDDSELGSGDVDPSDTTVCGTDGVSYPTICQIIPRHVRVRVLHAGQCNSRNCRGGLVCGTDGVTYENICVLRSRSSNARVDYRGNCTSNDNKTITQHCRRIIDENRCQFTSDNCRYLIHPSTGCCPICGSGVIVLLDLEGLRDAALVISRWNTLDGFVTDLFNTDFMVPIFERCKLEVSLTESGHLELIFTSEADNRQFCDDQANLAVEIIDSLISDSRKRRQSDNIIEFPSSYQYVIGAITLAAEADDNTAATDDNTATDETPTGGVSTSTVSFALLSLMLILAKIIN